MNKEDNISGEKVIRSFFFDKKQLEGLNRLSAITRVPQPVYIREGLDLVLNKYERKLKGGLKKKEKENNPEKKEI